MLAAGSSSDITKLGNSVPRLGHPESNRLEALMWGMRAKAASVSLRIGWSDHIQATVAHTLETQYGWTRTEVDNYLDGLQKHLIDHSGGRTISPVGSGYARMDDYEDSKVFETCRMLADGKPVILVTDGIGFIRKVEDKHKRPTGAASYISALTSKKFCELCETMSQMT